MTLQELLTLKHLFSSLKAKRVTIPSANIRLQRYIQTITLTNKLPILSNQEILTISYFVDSIKQSDTNKRILGLSANPDFWISDDFNDPLPDEFWFGEDSEN